MKILWTREAFRMLAEIEDFIAKDNEERAAKFVDEIVAHAESLLPREPRIGRVVPETANPEIRELLYRNYRIVYRIRKGAVEILTVFEGHRLLRTGELAADE